MSGLASERLEGIERDRGHENSQIACVSLTAAAVHTVWVGHFLRCSLLGWVCRWTI